MRKHKVCALNMVALDGKGTVPEEIKVLPTGWVKSQKGTFLVDEKSIQMIISHFRSRKIDLVVDYEHQTLSDVQAPAGGWIKDLYPKDNALMAKVEWTSKACGYISNKEYRYLSPVVIVRESDNRVVYIHSVALTNTPAVDGMPAIVNSLDFKEESEEAMELEELIALLGLSETATLEEVKEELKKLLEMAKNADDNEKTEVVANSTVLGLLGLTEDAKTEDVVTSIMKLKAGSSDVQLQKLVLQLKERDADEAVGAALKEGKITSAQKDWARSYALSDMEGFKKFVNAAPVIVPQDMTETKDAPEKKGELTDADKFIMKSLGLSEEDAKKYFYGCNDGE